MHNPFDRLFKINEVYTAETFLTLELPGRLPNAGVGGHHHALSSASHETATDKAIGGSLSTHGSNVVPEASNLWKLHPHETKAIINVKFNFAEPGKYHAYVHIKTEGDIAYILPVEVRVLPGNERDGCFALRICFDIGRWGVV